MAEAPLYERLMHYNKEDIYPFHMPGHKLGKVFSPSNLLNLDVTEVRGMDNLYEPEEVIAKAQELAAKTFGAEETIFLVNGSTAGVIASILGVCDPKDQLILARNSHHSAHHGMILGDITPSYINPKMVKKYGLLGGISSEDVEEAIKKCPEAKAVFITSPTYEGFTSNIKEIARIVHKYDKVLIVDEAHGAHFNFHSSFPKTALSQGADIVIQSLHKTLPALTQSALMHFQGNRVNRHRVKQILRMIQTSSPSYIFMGLMDFLRKTLDEEKNLWFEPYLSRLKDLRNELKKLDHIILLGEELNHQYAIEEIDISRLVFYTGYTNQSGMDIDKLLRDKYKIQMELSSEIHFIGITTVGDTQEGYKRLLNSLREIDKKLILNQKNADINNISYPPSEIMISPREAFYAPKEVIPLEDGEGKVCANFVVFYPPGIPLLSPGEKITKFHIEQIKRRKKEKTIEVIRRGEL
ncbi:MAG: hypothetical protein PWP07_1191 [Epulopiscium sp.]|jgi:lysine decarboxylase|uniref:Aminotransferase class I/II-fold pyridoxal phosphate-dependent enzyme n=1 Tax=Defluviitalea raffinosedens TaxID=1450156 RepID=A0A7C8LGA4_9FIRM|nr:aminotransferase class I/II-fold pyridoxal phosphate-dependent enzyme [Defluviitalea raffinosedens]KAE9628768.1 aminotransferase class I/II-fold pyridoxal phosphate-dependent enzyme [Defluviitalea raffinosedens]MDK2787966.1 hypothetical protein [Candidatus Epulonipiscium sp.]